MGTQPPGGRSPFPHLSPNFPHLSMVWEAPSPGVVKALSGGGGHPQGGGESKGGDGK